MDTRFVRCTSRRARTSSALRKQQSITSSVKPEAKSSASVGPSSCGFAGGGLGGLGLPARVALTGATGLRCGDSESVATGSDPDGELRPLPITGGSFLWGRGCPDYTSFPSFQAAFLIKGNNASPQDRATS